MNLQTVDDLIEELQRLPPAVRKQPVYLGIGDGARGDRSICVRPQGDTVVLRQTEEEVAGLPEPEGLVRDVTCPECQHGFQVNDDGEAR